MTEVAWLNPPEVLVDNIDSELKERSQWVNCLYVHDSKGRFTKRPYNPITGKSASTTDLMTWNSFETVYEAYKRGEYDGVGFVFCSGDPYTGVDLDGCRDADTGEIDDWASEIVRNLDGYTEISPSGTGLHIIVRGKIPAALKRERIEMYCTERFFTVTGHVIGGIR